ncbi:MAG: AI-2E family transporter [Paracoccaceae bacterium]
MSFLSDPEQMKRTGLETLAMVTCAVALMIMVGWLLKVGQSILLPVLVGVISVYILVTAAEAMLRLPVLGRLGRGWRRWLVLVAFIGSILFLGAIVASSAAAITASMPLYVENLDVLQAKLVDLLGLDDVPSVADYSERLMDRVDLTTLLPSVLSAVTGSGTVVITAALYAVFILADLDALPAKTRLAMGQSGHAEATLEVVRKINTRIGDYLAAKTLVNVILGLVSYVLMWLLGIEHAVFWALLIALLNYIPYVGSIIAVAFPVTMSLVQFASLWHSVVTLVLLFVPQMMVGYYIEPKFLGKSVNLSPFTVLLALALWTALWGMTGAVLAVPLTAMGAIILAEFDGTRFISVMLSDDGTV